MTRRILKTILIPTIALTGILFCSFSYVDSLKPRDIAEDEWIDSIAAALESGHIMQIDGEIFIVDSIPCATSATRRKGLFGRLVNWSYTDCSTCTSQPGKPDTLTSKGYCTTIRRYNGNK
ncbi:MAG: hypothetical protein NC336_07375 [Clostridium sp.]|nr:hypothetical protein [Clostridium sp.]